VDSPESARRLRAVKIVHRASFDHDRPFEREFAGIKAFETHSRSHEGLVNLLQVGRDDHAGYFYYVMELADDLNGGDPTQQASAPSPDSYTREHSPLNSNVVAGCPWRNASKSACR